MTKKGDIIRVIYSKRLEEAGNRTLVNRTGTVTRVVCPSGTITGIYADINIMGRTRNYYIPAASVDGSSDIDRMRTVTILKSTIL